ncbi:MAG: DUF898 family protein [Pseudomonadota bacterium]
MSDETHDGGAGGEPRAAWDLERYRTVPGTTKIRPTSTEQRQTHPEYTADGWTLFWMALRTSFMSIVTLGIYRFWMIVRLRRHYWGGILLRGDPLEYTGRGIEKLLGFLLAMVILAVYLGLVNLGLTFLGFSLATDDEIQAQIAFNLTLFATLPLIYFAQYRGMRYLLSRTRWRGIRFGMGPGSWGYMLRAVLLTILTVITAGLAYPYQHFKLAQYMTNRSWFGDQKFEQHGSWVELFAAWIWIYIMLLFIGLCVYGFAESGPTGDVFSILIGAVIYLVSLIGLYLSYVRYQFQAFKSLWSNKTLGEDISFESELNVNNAVGVFLTGSFLTSVTISVMLAIAGAVIGVVFEFLGAGGDGPSMADIFSNANDVQDLFLAMLRSPAVLIGFVLTYLAVIVVTFAVGQVFFTHRILRRKVDTMLIHNPGALSDSRQRAHDGNTEAGGFADALGVDVGAGF